MRSLHFSDSWLGVGNFLIDYSIPDRPILAHANLSIKLNDETPKRRIFFSSSSNQFLLSLYSTIIKSPTQAKIIYIFGYMFSLNLTHDLIRKVRVRSIFIFQKNKNSTYHLQLPQSKAMSCSSLGPIDIIQFLKTFLVNGRNLKCTYSDQFLVLDPNSFPFLQVETKTTRNICLRVF